MIFSYQGRNQTGQLVAGKIEAESSNRAAGQLAEQRIIPIKITKLPEVKPKRQFNVDITEWVLGGRVKLEELIFLCRQLHALSKAGVPIIRALTRIVETTRSLVMQKTLRGVIESLLSGQTLTVSFSHYPKVFPPLFLNLVEVGEHSGKLEETFLHLSQYFQLEEKTVARIKTATRYPFMVFLTMIMAIVIINFMVVPTFARLFRQFKLPLPWPTQMLIASSDFMVHYWGVLLVGLLSTLVALYLYWRTPSGRYRVDKWRLRIPVVGNIFRRIMLARFARTFAMMSEAGVPVLQAMDLVANALNNTFIAARIHKMRLTLEKGESLYNAAVNSQLFSPLVLQMLAIGEESGNVDEMLKQTAVFYDGEVDYDIARLSDLIQPFMVICLGVLVLILALGVLLPMWDMVKLARR